MLEPRCFSTIWENHRFRAGWPIWGMFVGLVEGRRAAPDLARNGET